MNNNQFDPTKDTEVIKFEEVTADIENYEKPPTDAEVLAAFIPAALREGALLIELKETQHSDIKHAVILTLNEHQCPIDSRPNDENSIEGIWCWNMRRASWYNLKFSDIDAAQPFPPIAEDQLE